jgi:hypothetical protein
MAEIPSEQTSGVQLHVDPVQDPTRYLGSATVVHGFVADFAHAVMGVYDTYLQGKEQGPQVQATSAELTTEHADALMGRSQDWEIAPWQGERLRGKFAAAIPSMKGSDDPGEAFFKHLALQCIKASMSLADGRGEHEVGRELALILHDARGRILGTVQ